MKKFFLLLMLAISFMACEGPMGPAGPAGMDGQDGKDGYGTNWFSRDFTIYKSDWTLKGNPGELNSYFYVTRTVPELT